MSQLSMKPSSSDAMQTGEDKNDYTLPCRGIKLIGIRFYPYQGTCNETKRKAMCIQKNLYDSLDWFYFNKGFLITGNEPYDPKNTYIEVDDNAFDSTFLLYSNQLTRNISISAVIGQNGTGKSTIVDTVIRLINNLAAAIIGEGYVYSSAQHLHYIENVFASLAVYIDNKIRILTCEDSKLYVSTYKADMQKLIKKGSNEKERYNHMETIVVLNGNAPKNKLLPPQKKLRHVLNDWFYTMVANYSLYAYNYKDYFTEKTSDAKIALLREIRPEDNKEEDEYWLKGVFHKNDGYQTPIVIHPMRNNGYVNAAQVNYLGKQNLISLAFMRNSHSEKEGDKFPFRVINQTHHLVAFYFYPLESNKYDSFIDGIIKEKFNLTERQKMRFSEIENPIKEFWAKSIGVETRGEDTDRAEKRAWNYVVYKTIKIFWNYKHYQEAWDDLMNYNSVNTIEKHLEELEKDSTHRTRKLRQALSFLRFHKENDYYMNRGQVVDLNDIYDWMQNKIGIQLYPTKYYHKIEIEDLLPPPYPITDVLFQLVDNEHIEEYKAIKNHSLNIIPFEGLSAGERQIAYTLGNIVYHLKNIESVKQDFNTNSHHIESLTYDYVNIILDEVELYFHPDLQRRFVSLLLDAIKGLNLNDTKGINVTLITHSPFVLSDIPDSNLLCLTRSGSKKPFGKTFAANIHDLFNDTFILPDTIGELAKTKILELVALYDRQKTLWEETDEDKIDCKSDNSILKQLKSNKKRYEYLVNIIGDEYLHDELKDMLKEMTDYYHLK